MSNRQDSFRTRRLKRRSKGYLSTTILFVLAVITVLPFYIMVCMGTVSTNELFQGIILLPGKNLIKNLSKIGTNTFVQFYVNSFISSAAATIIGTLTSAMAGFALSKYRFRAKASIIKLVMAMMMVPGQISLIGYVIEMREMHLLNTLWPVIIPFSYSAFGVYWMKQSIDGAVPNEVLESARIDGASEFQVFFTIVIPYIGSALVTIGLLLFLWSWNSYLLPLITINNMDSYTVPLGLAMLDGMYSTDYATKILALTIGTLPLVVMFGFGSKYFIRGLTGGALKG